MTTAVATVPETITLNMHMDQIGYDAPDSAVMLQKLGDTITVINRANTYFRVLMGLQLAEIRDGQFWMEPELWADGVPEPKNWRDWIDNHFAIKSGVSRETGYGAMQIAQSKALLDLGEDGLKQHKSLTNATVLAKLEKNNPEKARELAPLSMDMPAKEFRKIAGVHPERGNVSTITQSPDQADALTLIVERIKDAPADAIRELHTLIEEEVAPTCGDNPGDIVDFTIAALREHVKSEMGQPQSFYEGF